jgi:hypothetical protein
MAFCAKTLRAAGLLSMTCVGSAVTARCGDAPASPPWPQPKSLAAAPLVIFKQALKRKCRKRFGWTLKTVLSALLSLQLLALLALAASPALHHVLHHDSDKPDHDCLVTIFAKGQLSAAVMTPVVAFFAAFLIYALLLPGLPPRSLFEYRFAPSRAPPRF